MDLEIISRRVLEILKPEDLELLLNSGFRRAYERGEVIVASGETVTSFYLIEEGVVVVEAAPPDGPRYLRPGQVFGSTSLIYERPIPHNIRAHEEVIVLVLSGKDLDWLTEAEPAIAARVLRALASALAARNLNLPVGAGALPEAPGRAEPSGLARFAEACRDTRAALEAMGPAPEDGQAYWARERIPAVA